MRRAKRANTMRAFVCNVCAVAGETRSPPPPATQPRQQQSGTPSSQCVCAVSATVVAAAAHAAQFSQTSRKQRTCCWRRRTNMNSADRCGLCGCCSTLIKMQTGALVVGAHHASPDACIYIYTNINIHSAHIPFIHTNTR